MTRSHDNTIKIIAFSDRPYRIVKTMTANQLHNMWGESSSSFRVDPPNAILYSREVDSTVVIIEGFSITSEGSIIRERHTNYILAK